MHFGTCSVDDSCYYKVTSLKCNRLMAVTWHISRFWRWAGRELYGGGVYSWTYPGAEGPLQPPPPATEDWNIGFPGWGWRGISGLPLRLWRWVELHLETVLPVRMDECHWFLYVMVVFAHPCITMVWHAQSCLMKTVSLHIFVTHIHTHTHAPHTHPHHTHHTHHTPTPHRWRKRRGLVRFWGGDRNCKSHLICVPKMSGCCHGDH